MANQPLAGGYFGVIYALKGDLEYFTKSLKLRHFNSLDMCDLCPATRRDSDRSLMYNNFDRDAAWKLRGKGAGVPVQDVAPNLAS